MRGTPSTKTKSTGPKWDESKKFIRQEAAAERWDVSVDTIRRMISSGKITGYRLNNRIIRVDVAEVDAAFNVIPNARSTRPSRPQGKAVRP